MKSIVQNLDLISSAHADSAQQTPVAVAPATTTATTQVAPTPGGVPAGGPQPSPLMSLVPFVLMFGVIYLLMIRPQQKKVKEHQGLIEKLKQGDEVVTQAGIIGTISNVADKIVTLEVDKNVRLKVLKSQVASVVKGEATAP